MSYRTLGSSGRQGRRFHFAGPPHGALIPGAPYARQAIPTGPQGRRSSLSHGRLEIWTSNGAPLSVLILQQEPDAAAGSPIVCVRACCSLRCFACVCSIIKVNLLDTLPKHVENSSLQLRNSMLNLIQIVWLLFTAFFLAKPSVFFLSSSSFLSSYTVRTYALLWLAHIIR